MKSPSTPLILTIATLALQSRATSPITKCNADNCARAVTGTAKGPATLAAHMADCSSFQWATFTPETFYETVTVTTVSVAPRHNRYRGRRDNLRGGGGRGRGGLGSVSYPTHVPAYASACSCAGITGGTTTVEGVTVTVTETEAPVTT